METLTGVLTSVKVYDKVTKLFLDGDTETPFLSFGKPFKVPIFLKGCVLNITHSSNVIKHVTVDMPILGKRIIEWIHHFIECMAKKEPFKSAADKRALTSFCLEYASSTPLLDTLIKATQGHANAKYKQHLWPVLTEMRVIIDKLGVYHRLKEDVVSFGFQGKIPDSTIVQALSFCDDYGSFCKNPGSITRAKAVTHTQFKALTSFASMYKTGDEERALNTICFHLHDSMTSAGHTCCPLSHMIGFCAESIIRKHVGTLFYIYNEKWLYFQSVWDKETFIVQKIQHYVDGALEINPDPDPDLDERIAKYEKDNGIAFHENQRTGLCSIFRMHYGMHIITGLPGSGKSSVVKCVTTMARDLNMRVAMCAPTGKAANRLGREGSTIHRTLEVQVSKDGKWTFQRNCYMPLEVDILIVDEASMLDLVLTYHLLHACRDGMRILVLGDDNQLPSVQYGNILSAWIKSGVVPVTHLTRIFRQGAGSTISKLAKCIVAGSVTPLLERYLNDPKGQVVWFDMSDVKCMHKQALHLYNLHGGDCAMLIPMRKNDIGTMAMNATMHRYIYKEDGLRLKPGEKIICTANSYARNDDGEVIPEQSIFNGDTGTFVSYKTGGNIEVNVNNVTVLVDHGIVEMGYACTVHKMQGSEHDIVILILHESHGIMLNREIFYTAVTRAKEKLYVIGNIKSIKKCITNRTQHRYECMSERIRADYDIF